MSFFGKWPGRWLRGRVPSPRASKAAGRRARLVLEILEDRCLPSSSSASALALAHQSWRAQTFTTGDIRVVNQNTVTTQAMQGQSLIGADLANANLPYHGTGYSVAIIDTGIDYNNPALGSGFGVGHRVIAGWDFVNNDADPMDDNGHGTHVAGIIGSSDPTYTGVAPDVNFIALKVLDANGSGSFGAVEDALNWVVAHQAEYHIVAINMSLGAGNYQSNPYTFLEDEFTALKQEGVFIAAAAGNSFYTYGSQQGLGYPAISPQVVSVGAVWAGNFGQVGWQSGAIDYTTATDRIASFSQRSSQLSILAPGALITSTYLHNSFQTMAGTSMATPFVAGAAVLIHQAFDAAGQSNLANPDNILSRMQSTGVSVVDGDDENDNVVNTGLTFKRLDLYAALTSIAGTNHAPVLNAVANQTMKASQHSLTVTLSATDADGNPLAYSARVTGNGALAYQLDQQYQLGFNGNYYTNFYGQNEKWMQSPIQQLFILPNGEVRKWMGTMSASLKPSALVGTLDSSYYADPSLLWNATAPPMVSVSGNQLTITPAAGFSGSFTVQATVSDGLATDSKSFTVSVTNAAPVLAAVPDQTMSGSSLTVALSATDADGDPLTYSARVTGPAALAYQIDQQYQLGYNGNYYTNYYKQNEKWMQSPVQQLFILPNGEVRKWMGSMPASMQAAALVGTLDAGYYADPSKLWNAPALPTIAVAGSQLTINANGFTGSFIVQATVSDSVATDTKSFSLTTSGAGPLVRPTPTNQPPTLAAIADQTAGAAQGRLTVSLFASDPNGDPLTFSATTTGGTSRAYQLDQQYGFYYAGSYYTNSWGVNEKWLLGNGGQWFLLMPNGELRQYQGTTAATLGAAGLVATLPTAYYTDPSLLWNAQAFQASAIGYQVTGNQLTITYPSSFTGTIVVQVTVSDGQATATRSFTVTVA